MPIPQLVIPSNKLYGRKVETELLRNVHRSLTTSEECRRPRIILGGASGTGKSALLRAAFGDGNTYNDSSLVQGWGKFEFGYQNAAPYRALIQALEDLCEHMIQYDAMTDLTTTRKYSDILTSTLAQQDLTILCNLIPTLKKVILGETTRDDKDYKQQEPQYSKDDAAVLKRALCEFLAAVATPERPLLLVLDDVQWMDKASLALVQSMVSNSSIQYWIFVIAHRNEPQELERADPAVLKWIQDMEKEAATDPDNATPNKCDDVEQNPADGDDTDSTSGSSSSSNDDKDATATTTVLSLKPLGMEAIVELLTEVLKTEHVQDLADIMYSRTHGNAFHVLQLLDHLQATDLITFSTATFSWTWDVQKIKNKTSLSENVLDMVTARMERLSAEERACLTLGSFIGIRFDRDVYFQISNVLEDHVLTNPEAALSSVVGKSLIEQIRDPRYKFVHDRIREAALKLIPDQHTKASTHLRIGQNLIKPYSLDEHFEKMNDSLLFLCCDQMNLGKTLIKDDKEKFQLLKLNLLAGKRASSFSAFAPALGYLQTAVELIPNRISIWTDQYSLSLKLFTLVAEIGQCAGQSDVCKGAIDEVISHAKSIADSFPIYVVQIQDLVASNDMTKLLSSGLALLEKLGEKFPRQPGDAVLKRHHARIKKQLDKFSDEQLLHLPITNDKQASRAIHVMTLIAVSLNRSNDVECQNLSVLFMYRMAELSLDRGLAPYSPYALSLLGIACIMRKDDIETAWRLAKVSQQLTKRPGLQQDKEKTFINVLFVSHWREPLSQIVDVAIDVHKGGFQSGDLWSAFQGVVIYGHMYFYSGLTLEPLAADFKKFSSMMVDFGYSLAVLWLLPCYQFVLNLAGKSNSVLDIGSQSVAKYYRNKIGWESRGGEHSEWNFCMQAAVYCEEIERAATFAKKLKELESNAFEKGLFTYPPRIFFFAIVAIWQAKKTGKRKYKKEAKSYADTMEVWVVEKQNINMAHKYLIVQAEMLSMEGKASYESQKASYDKAIAASIRAGFLQDGALALHLASRALAHDCDTYFERAKEMYVKWGAVAVVERLMLNRNDTSELSLGKKDNGTRHRSRARFDNSLIDSHRNIVLDSDDEL